ncbi:hypothetical protein [Kutzneria buriramensis]|uniref:hypothetical protein n=1 Tax=Kutzneria buriramensis TaxID=1045776 RepID=UPI0011C1096B|nr:hypothetical protein [Kutzneria buriramensis]
MSDGTTPTAVSWTTTPAVTSVTAEPLAVRDGRLLLGRGTAPEVTIEMTPTSSTEGVSVAAAFEAVGMRLSLPATTEVSGQVVTVTIEISGGLAPETPTVLHLTGVSPAGEEVFAINAPVVLAALESSMEAAMAGAESATPAEQQ